METLSSLPNKLVYIDGRTRNWKNSVKIYIDKNYKKYKVMSHDHLCHKGSQHIKVENGKNNCAKENFLKHPYQINSSREKLKEISVPAFVFGTQNERNSYKLIAVKK